MGSLSEIDCGLAVELSWLVVKVAQQLLVAGGELMCRCNEDDI